MYGGSRNATLTCHDDANEHESEYQKFGERGNDAVSKELRHLHNRKAMLPVLKDDISSEDKKKALRYLMFIKEKRDRAIKARGCAVEDPSSNTPRKGAQILQQCG